MMAQIYHLAPKGTAWLIYHRCWRDGGCHTSWALVFDYQRGLTAYEAWQKTSLPDNPQFYEVIATQLTPYPAGAARGV